jgi:hypothetical protein
LIGRIVAMLEGDHTYRSFQQIGVESKS